MMTVEKAIEVIDACDYSTTEQAGKKIGDLVTKEIMTIKEASFIMACCILAIEYLNQREQK